MSDQRDFFISYTRVDEAWAEWIAWQLEAAGYAVTYQKWDFRPGQNFVIAMHEAANQARRTMPILSADYLRSGFGASEWAAAFAQDPTGSARQVIPVRVHPCALEGLLSPIVYIDLVDVDETDARERLLAGVADGRAKPAVQPPFPGIPARALIDKPPFPGPGPASSQPRISPSIHQSAAHTKAGVDDLLQRALAEVPVESRGHATAKLGLIVSSGPQQVIVRPSHMEGESLRERLIQRALFGSTKVFDLAAGGVQSRVEDDKLVLTHESSTIRLDEFGSLAVFQSIDQPRSQRRALGGFDHAVLIEEEVTNHLGRAMDFVTATLDDLDAQHRLSSVAIVAALIDVGHRVWRTLDEHRASPNQIAFPMRTSDRVVVYLSPSVQPRQTLADDRDGIIADLIVRLRRKLREP